MAQSIPVSNPQPKTRFQQSGDNVSKHRDLVDSSEFQRAADFGILQYVAAETQRITDYPSAAAVGYKIQGAMEFLNTVRQISEKPIPMPTIAPANLDHRS